MAVALAAKQLIAVTAELVLGWDLPRIDADRAVDISLRTWAVIQTCRNSARVSAKLFPDAHIIMFAQWCRILDVAKMLNTEM